MNQNDELINYESIDGTKLVGILNHSVNNENCIIMCHGLKPDKEEYGTFTYLSEIFREFGYSSFRFDFRAHGQSDGTDVEMTLVKLKEDLEATIFLMRESGFREIYILGASFGASILSLIDYEKFPDVKKLIIWSGSIDFSKGNPNGSLGNKNYMKAMQDGCVVIDSKTTGKKMKLSKNFMEETRNLHPEDKIRDINLPILFIHGTEDETTPHEVNKKIANSCKKACFISISKAEHGLHSRQDTIMASRYIIAFLNMRFSEVLQEMVIDSFDFEQE